MRLSLCVFMLMLIGSFQNLKANFFAREFDKTAYYHILKSGSIKEIDDEIAQIESSSINGKGAFVGTLLMKKAGLVKVPKQKLDAFKSGRIKFEQVYRNDTSNVEYHFLRLIIQEHAPKIVKYSNNISGDADFIKKNYRTLSSDVQKILIDYSQTSKALKPQDFQS